MSREAAKDFIDQHYAEFPDTVLHARLCIAFAKRDGRSVPQALRAFAAARLVVVESAPLRTTLLNMSRSPFPETDVARVRLCVEKMMKHATKEMRRQQS